MAIRYQKKLKDSKNRKNYLLNEKKKRYYKFMSMKYNRILTTNLGYIKMKALNQLRKFDSQVQEMPRSKITNYCILTGRSRGVYRDFKLSRHQIKTNFKFLTGLRNSSF